MKRKKLAWDSPAGVIITDPGLRTALSLSPKAKAKLDRMERPYPPAPRILLD